MTRIIGVAEDSIALVPITLDSLVHLAAVLPTLKAVLKVAIA